MWITAAGIIGAVLAFAYIQRAFTPTIDLYFQTEHARGLTKNMAVKLIGFNIGSLTEISRSGELRVRGKIVIDREHRNDISKDSRLRLTKEGVLGAYILEVIPGGGDVGPVVSGDTLEYEREVDYSVMVKNLIDRIGPVVDDIHKVSSQLGDPATGVQATLRRLDEVGVSFVQAGRSISKFGVDGSRFAADASRVTNDIPARIEPVLKDMQRNLTQMESLIKQLNADVPPMLGDSRKLLQSLTATSESMQRLLNDDVPRVLRKGESVVQDADEIVGGVKRSWPVKNMLPPGTSEKPVELDSADGAVHAAPRTAMPE
jgi:phospholipid/cholesterol/gamma-HCH transport system substrate-binding protein